MGDIFARADAVLITFGPHTDGSEELLDMLQQFYEKNNRITEFIWNVWLDNCGYAQVLRFYRALHAFVNRAYWRRVWIVQELMVAKAIYVCSGTDLIDWLLITRLRHFRWALPKLLARSEDRPKTITETADFSIDIAPMWTIIETLKQRRLSFKYIVSTFSTWQCTHPLDRIYGFLHIVDWPSSSQDRLRPDYSKSAFDSMLDCMDRVIWSSSARANSAWMTARRLMTCLHLNDRDPDVYEVLRERRKPLQTGISNLTPTRPSPLSFGLDFNKRPFILGKLEFWGVSRLAEHSSRIFTAALIGGLKDEPNCWAETPNQSLPLLFPLVERKLQVPQNLDQGFCAGFICPDAKEDDLLLQPADFSPAVDGYIPCLVARKVLRLEVYEIIGYAAISQDCRFCQSSDDHGGLSEKQGPLEIDDHLSFEGALCKEDVVAYMTLWQGGRGTSLLRSPFEEILTTRSTSTRFSSFIVQRERDRHFADTRLARRRASWVGRDDFARHRNADASGRRPCRSLSECPSVRRYSEVDTLSNRSLFEQGRRDAVVLKKMDRSEIPGLEVHHTRLERLEQTELLPRKGQLRMTNHE